MTDKKEYFTKQFKRLTDYFGLKITNNQLDSYYGQLLYIEDESLKLIVDRIISDRKPFKTNFPTIAEFGPLYESSRSHDDEIKDFIGEDCEECDGEGLLYFKLWHFKLGKCYEKLAVCAMCNNWKKYFNSIDAQSVFIGGSFLYRHPGIEYSTKEQLTLKYGVIEVADNGIFKLNQEQISQRVLEFYGE